MQQALTTLSEGGIQSVVTDMRSMFSGAAVFDQPIGMWDTSSVKDMSFMFSEATSFNSPIENWSTVSVTNMTGMFFGASVFNGSLQTWDTSFVRSMAHMFQEASFRLERSVGSSECGGLALLGLCVCVVLFRVGLCGPVASVQFPE